MKKLYYIILVSLCLVACTDPVVVDEYNNDPRDNFDALWTILDERYCYFDAKSVNWDDMYNHYVNYTKNVRDNFELFDIFASMLDTLQDGHVNLYSPFDVSICKGWYDNYPANYSSEIVYGEKYLGDDYKIAAGVHYGRIADDNIGFMRYSSFSSSITYSGMAYIDYYFKNCKGIIIDVRNNGGGSLERSEQLAACFFKDVTTTGYQKHKLGKGHNNFSEAEEIITDPAMRYIDWSDKKVVVLCNRRCYSATNDFIVRMLKAENVTVVGGRTGGGGGIPLSQELPNGWMIRFSAVPMFDSEMRHTEFGVDPDIEINTTSEDEQKGEDTIIEKAIEIILKQ